VTVESSGIPISLSESTFGDALARLLRGRAEGVLEVADHGGRQHRVFVRGGRVVRVHLDGAGPTLADILRNDRRITADVQRRSLLRALVGRRRHGEVLMREFGVPKSVVDEALRRQHRSRLDVVEQRAPRSARFVPGAVEGADDGVGLDVGAACGGRRRQRDDANASPFSVLGLGPGATGAEVRAAYRRLVRELHPDALDPHLSAAERAARIERFRAVTDAYRTLVDRGSD
jgi:hypothetical protein